MIEPKDLKIGDIVEWDDWPHGIRVARIKGVDGNIVRLETVARHPKYPTRPEKKGDAHVRDLYPCGTPMTELPRSSHKLGPDAGEPIVWPLRYQQYQRSAIPIDKEKRSK